MLEQNTGHYDQVYHRYDSYVGFIIPFNGTNCYATYNRDYDFLKRCLPNYEIVIADHNKSKAMKQRISLVNIESFKPAQSEMITLIDNSLKTKSSNAWFVNLQTDSGKTVLAVYYATRFNLKTIILCFSDTVLLQWESTFKNRTTIDPNRMVRLNGAIIDGILGGLIDPDEYDVYIATPTLLDRFATDRRDYIKILDFFNRAGIGFLVFDEAHHHTSSIVRLLSVVNPKYQMYLSADFSQGNFEKEDQFRKVFHNIPVLKPTTELARTMKHTKVMVVEFNTYPTAIEKEAPFNRYGFDANLYMSYEFSKGVIQKLIFHLIHTCMSIDKNYRMLILFTNVKHVEEMYSIIKMNYPQYKVGKFHGEMKKEDKLWSKDQADIIIATYTSFSTGLDTHDIKYVVSCNQCNKVQDNQAAGRSRPLPDGTDGVYFMLIDVGFSYSRSKLKTRLFYLSETKSKDDIIHRYVYNNDVHEGEDNS